MWDKIWKLLQTVITLARDLEQTRKDVRDIQQEVLKLTMAVQHLSIEIQLAKREDASEREKMAMQLQIEFLKFEKRLPSPSSTTKSSGEDA